MKIPLTIIALFFSLTVAAQKVKEGSVITITNFAWDCGTGYNPKKAYVVKQGNKLYIKAQFDLGYKGSDDFQFLPIKKAFAYWKLEETKIVRIKY